MRQANYFDYNQNDEVKKEKKNEQQKSEAK